MKNTVTLLAVAAIAGSANAALDGQSIPTDAANDGLSLLATQANPTGFGDATGGGQDAGGSELNQLWASLDGSTLNVSITGNLESNFNKLWIFFDAVAGGEQALGSDNADGGFGEINNLAGSTFGAGNIGMDHALRLEVGGSFYGVRYADLIDNVGGDIATGAGFGDLPLASVAGNLGVDFGWDNSNILGVDGASAAGASSATKGWEFSIDLASFFGPNTKNQIGISAFISSGDGNFVSNQVLPSLDPDTGNLAGPPINVGVAYIPAPGTMALAGLAGFAATRRRRA